jgi:hypothetical protein
LQTLHENFRDKTLYNSPEITGASLNEALARYRRYERKLDDQVKPCDETLKRLSTTTSLQQLQQQQQQQLYSSPNNNLRSNFTTFPNGDLRAKNVSVSSNEEESISIDNNNNNINNNNNNNNNNDHQHQQSTNVKPVRPAYQIQPNGFMVPKKQLLQPNLATMIKQDKKTRYLLYGEDYASSNDSDNESNNRSNDDKNCAEKPVTEIKYDLETVLKYLDQGYYLSRIQVRNAFALYLFKIHVRLVTESQNKDESNVQQMELVLRFIRKAAPNLSQEFTPYTPSRRLPMSEQKRMLAKQLHDFLHIYRKDTGQIRIDMNTQLEEERKKYRRKLIDEKAFQTLLYKCCEAELEEIMSVYMKNSQDSSVFLGSCKNLFSNENNTNTTNNNNNNNEIIDFNLTNNNNNQDNKPKPSLVTLNNNTSITLKSALVNKNKYTPPVGYNQQTMNVVRRPETSKEYNPIKQQQPSTIKTEVQSSSKTNNKIPTLTNTSNKKLTLPATAVGAVGTNKKTNTSGEEELSGLSCDSNSGFSNSSSESVKHAADRSRSASRSLSRSTSISSRTAATTKSTTNNKQQQQQKQKEKRLRESKSAAPHRFIQTPATTSSSTKTNSPVNHNQTKLINLNEKSIKSFGSNNTLLNAKKYDYETIIKNIYLNTTHKFPLSNSINSSSSSSSNNKNKIIRPITSVINNNNSNGKFLLQKLYYFSIFLNNNFRSC